MVSKGTLALRAALADRGEKAKFARKLGINLSQLSNWLAGRGGPDTGNRASIEDEIGIGWRLWDEPAEEDEAKDEPNGSAA